MRLIASISNEVNSIPMFVHIYLSVCADKPCVSLRLQVQYSLLDQRPVQSGLVQLCDAQGIKILAYGVLAGGFLTDKWLGKPAPDLDVSDRARSRVSEGVRECVGG